MVGYHDAKEALNLTHSSPFASRLKIKRFLQKHRLAFVKRGLVDDTVIK